MAQPDPDISKRVSSMQRPIAGQSLTNDPANPQAFEKAPEYTDITKALEYLFEDLTEEDRYEAVMQSVSSRVPIMDVTKIILYDGFQKGLWNPDLLMMLAEPFSYMIMALAEKAGIDYIINREDMDNEEEDEVPPVGLGRMDQTIRESKPTEESLPPEIKERVENVQVPSLLGEQ